MAPNDWQESPFAEAIDFQEGPGILAKDFRASGVPLIRLSGLDASASVLTGCNFLDAATVARKWSHFSLAEGDVLLSTSASLGRVATVGAEGAGAIPYTGIIRMRPREGRVVAPFIRYLLAGPEFSQQVDAAGVGSVIRHFGPMHLRRMSVHLPPPNEQRAIAHILGTLDDKIELNRQMNETLEAIARAIFKSWFVDFDPVRAKASGESPESICYRLGLTEELLALFPDRFADSVIGEIPKGWEVRGLDALATLSTESVSPSAQPDEVFEHYSIPAFDAAKIPAFDLGKSIKSNKYVVPPCVVLVSKLNPATPRVWLPAVRTERAVCSTEFMPFGACPDFCV
jgi:type I restriction enzyme, S subunit